MPLALYPFKFRHSLNFSYYALFLDIYHKMTISTFELVTFRQRFHIITIQELWAQDIIDDRQMTCMDVCQMAIMHNPMYTI